HQLPDQFVIYQGRVAIGARAVENPSHVQLKFPPIPTPAQSDLNPLALASAGHHTARQRTYLPLRQGSPEQLPGIRRHTMTVHIPERLSMSQETPFFRHGQPLPELRGDRSQ